MINYITIYTSVAVESNPQSYQYEQTVVVSFINFLIGQKFLKYGQQYVKLFFILSIQIDSIEHVK